MEATFRPVMMRDVVATERVAVHSSHDEKGWRLTILVFKQRALRLAAGLAVSLAGMLPGAPAVNAAPAYKISLLDVLPGGGDSLAFDLNDAGLVVGASMLDRSGRISQSRPVTWEASQPRELWNSLPGGRLQAVNNSGGYVGSYGSSSDAVLPGAGVPFGRAFYWSDTTGLVDIGLEPVGNSQAIAINDAGWVAGTSERFEIVDAGNGEMVSANVSHAFFWTLDGGARAIGDLNGGDSIALAMNSQGQVVGYGNLKNGEWGAFVWDETNGIRQLPTPSAGSAQAVAINDHGKVLAGGSAVGGSAIWDVHTGVWQAVPIGASDINNRGQVVGSMGIGKAFLWEEGVGARVLSELVSLPEDWSLDYAFAVNEAGEIVGYGIFDGAVRGYLATPVPEPGAWQLITGVALLAHCFKRSKGR